jgi:copper chaperone CopZ
MATPNQLGVTLSWHLPALIERPAVGTSCCATTAEALLSSELFLLPGVLDLTVDIARGRVDVVTDPARVDAGMIAMALEEIGYPPEFGPHAHAPATTP